MSILSPSSTGSVCVDWFSTAISTPTITERTSLVAQEALTDLGNSILESPTNIFCATVVVITVALALYFLFQKCMEYSFFESGEVINSQATHTSIYPRAPRAVQPDLTVSELTPAERELIIIARDANDDWLPERNTPLDIQSENVLSVTIEDLPEINEIPTEIVRGAELAVIKDRIYQMHIQNADWTWQQVLEGISAEAGISTAAAHSYIEELRESIVLNTCIEDVIDRIFGRETEEDIRAGLQDEHGAHLDIDGVMHRAQEKKRFLDYAEEVYDCVHDDDLSWDEAQEVFCSDHPELTDATYIQTVMKEAKTFTSTAEFLDPRGNALSIYLLGIEDPAQRLVILKNLTFAQRKELCPALKDLYYREAIRNGWLALGIDHLTYGGGETQLVEAPPFAESRGFFDGYTSNIPGFAEMYPEITIRPNRTRCLREAEVDPCTPVELLQVFIGEANFVDPATHLTREGPFANLAAALNSFPLGDDVMDAPLRAKLVRRDGENSKECQYIKKCVYKRLIAIDMCAEGSVEREDEIAALHDLLLKIVAASSGASHDTPSISEAAQFTKLFRVLSAEDRRNMEGEGYIDSSTLMNDGWSIAAYSIRNGLNTMSERALSISLWGDDDWRHKFNIALTHVTYLLTDMKVRIKTIERQLLEDPERVGAAGLRSELKALRIEVNGTLVRLGVAGLHCGNRNLSVAQEEYLSLLAGPDTTGSTADVSLDSIEKLMNIVLSEQRKRIATGMAVTDVGGVGRGLLRNGGRDGYLPRNTTESAGVINSIRNLIGPLLGLEASYWDPHQSLAVESCYLEIYRNQAQRCLLKEFFSHYTVSSMVQELIQQQQNSRFHSDQIDGDFLLEYLRNNHPQKFADRPGESYYHHPVSDAISTWAICEALEGQGFISVRD